MFAPIFPTWFSDAHKQQVERFIRMADDSLFHHGQQSHTAQFEMRRRSILMYEQRRDALMGSYLNQEKNCADLQHPFNDADEVVMCVDVNFNDHQELIAPSSRETANDTLGSIIAETKTKIVFPDKPGPQKDSRIVNHKKFIQLHNSDILPYLNQVTITGTFEGVSEARRRIRDLTPLTLCFFMHSAKKEWTPVAFGKWLCEMKAQNRISKNILVQLVPIAGVYGSFPEEMVSSHLVIINARFCYAEAVVSLCELFKTTLFAENVHDDVLFSAQLEVPNSYWEAFTGNQSSILIATSKLTGAQIHYPPKTDAAVVTFFCSGTAQAVVDACLLLQSLMPVFLCVNIRHNDIGKFDVQRDQVYYDERNFVSIIHAKSEFEPENLLQDEEQRHFVQFATREININGLYNCFSRWLDKSTKFSKLNICKVEDPIATKFLVNVKEFFQPIGLKCNAAPQVRVSGPRVAELNDSVISVQEDSVDSENEANLGDPLCVSVCFPAAPTELAHYLQGLSFLPAFSYVPFPQARSPPNYQRSRFKDGGNCFTSEQNFEARRPGGSRYDDHGSSSWERRPARRFNDSQRSYSNSFRSEGPFRRRGSGSRNYQYGYGFERSYTRAFDSYSYSTGASEQTLPEYKKSSYKSGDLPSDTYSAKTYLYSRHSVERSDDNKENVKLGPVDQAPAQLSNAMFRGSENGISADAVCSVENARDECVGRTTSLGSDDMERKGLERMRSKNAHLKKIELEYRGLRSNVQGASPAGDDAKPTHVEKKHSPAKDYITDRAKPKSDLGLTNLTRNEQRLASDSDRSADGNGSSSGNLSYAEITARPGERLEPLDLIKRTSTEIQLRGHRSYARVLEEGRH